MRRFELARIEAELRRCLELGAREVTFVDPCFARRPGLEELLELLRRLGRGRLAVRCELNAEDVTLAKAEALARAGVREVEIGLQTTNPRALRLAQRPFHERRFLEGVRALRGEGVRVLLDVMVGLPGDALEDVKRSVEFAVSRKLFDDLKVYPLCVLPGTVFRRRAGELGLVHQSAPPYHILQGAQMSPRDIYDALSFAEQACGEDLFPIDVPGPLRNTSVVRGATIDPGCDLAPLPGDRLGQALRIDVRDPSWTRRLPEIRRAFGPALAKNPYTLLSWFLPARPFPDRRLVARLERLFPRASHTLDRDWFATHHPQRSLQTFVTFPRTARVRLPSDLLETPVSDSQRACAVHFVRDVSESTEAKFVDELAQHLDPDVWFRISAPS